MPAIQRRRWTAADVRQLIADHAEPRPRFELVRGELLVTPSPNGRHQRLALELAKALDAYVRRHHLGETRISPSDVALSSESILQPDVYVIPAENGKRRPAADRVTLLLLAVEILSASSARFDRVDKRREYQENRVPEYWIVDPDGEVIERWRPDDDRPEVLDTTLTWVPDGASEPFALDIVALFADVADEESSTS